jgi:hypothetical protein
MKSIRQFFCVHNYKFVLGQRVYLTESKYHQMCTKCKHERAWEAEVMLMDLEVELMRTKQFIIEGFISNEHPPYDTKGGERLVYRGYFLYETDSGRWRIKYYSGDSFAVNDGYLPSRNAAEAYVDALIYTNE